MTDPVTTGIASAVTRYAVDQIRDYIRKSDDPVEAWEEAARECIIQSQVAFQQKYEMTSRPDRKGLKRDIGKIGRSARELAVRGESREYDEDMIELISEFATACADYSGSATLGTAKNEKEFESQLSNVGSEIIESTK
jgi:hypothetical protein